MRQDLDVSDRPTLGFSRAARTGAAAGLALALWFSGPVQAQSEEPGWARMEALPVVLAQAGTVQHWLGGATSTPDWLSSSAVVPLLAPVSPFEAYAQGGGAEEPLLLAQAGAPAPAPVPEAQQTVGVGQVTHLSGTLLARRTDGSVKLLSVKSNVVEGDTLSTQDGTYARVKFSDGAEVVLRPTSQLKVESYQFADEKPASDNVVLNLLRGGLRKVTGLVGRRNRDRVRVAAPNATIGIRGTHFGMLLCQSDCGSIKLPGGAAPANGLHVDVAAGAVTLNNQGGTQQVNAGQFAFASADARVPPAIVPPSQGIQVTMPPAIARNDTQGRTMGANRSDDGCSIH